MRINFNIEVTYRLNWSDERVSTCACAKYPVIEEILSILATEKKLKIVKLPLFRGKN